MEKHQVRFNLLSPGVQYEIGLFRNVTAATSFGLGLATPTEQYSLAPVYNAKAKFYHSLKRRQERGRSIAGNSANFFAVTFNNYFTKWQIAGDLDEVGRDLTSMGVVYGIQRTYKNGFSFEAEVGSGIYLRDRVPIGDGLIIGLNIGWTPPKKKKNKILWQN